MQALMAAQEDDLTEVTFRTPIIKICQATTREVKEGDAEAGEFLYTLTGDSLGTQIDFIIAYFQKGRSVSTKSGGYRNAIGTDVIPDDPIWREAVGEAFIGTRFDEYPDAEEQYKDRVNSGEIEKWGSGPQVSTTYNYTGLVITDSLEDEDDEVLYLPGRMSLLRSTKSAHDKVQQIKQSTMRHKAFWDVTWQFSTQIKEFGRNTSFIVNAKKGRATTPDEVAQAVELAQAVVGGRIVDNSDVAEGGVDKAPEAPEGALGV